MLVVANYDLNLTPEMRGRLYELMKVEKMEMWIDDNEYLLRTTMQVAVEDAPLGILPGEMSMAIDPRVSGYNEPIVIAPPKSS